jgi:hypothetical protein
LWSSGLFDSFSSPTSLPRSPPQLPSRNNPTPSIPASQPLMQDRTQCRLEASQQRQTAQILSATNPPATVQTTNMSVSSTTRTNLQHLRPLEPRPIQATQPAPFPQAAPAFVQYIQNYPPHSNYQHLRPLEPHPTQATCVHMRRFNVKSISLIAH